MSGDPLDPFGSENGETATDGGRDRRHTDVTDDNTQQQKAGYIRQNGTVLGRIKHRLRGLLGGDRE